MSFGLDSNFSEARLLGGRINADLANNLGNLLVSRTLNMSKRYADARVPEPGTLEEPEREVEAVASAAAGGGGPAHASARAAPRPRGDFHDRRRREPLPRGSEPPGRLAKDPALAERVWHDALHELRRPCAWLRVLLAALPPR